jgi:zinc protease
MPVPASRNPHHVVLDNGLTVIIAENAIANIIAARIFVKAGSLWETPQQAGLTHLLTTLLTRGTDSLSALDIAEQVESVGASLSADMASDYCLLSLKTVTSDFENIFQLAGQLLRYSSFPEAEIELERRLALQAIRSQKEQPYVIAMEQLRQAMYPNHPYGFSGLGTEATVSQLTRNDLQEFHASCFRPDQVIVSLAGDITIEAAIAIVDHVFGDWQRPTQLPLPLEPKLSHSHPQMLVTSQPTQQAIVMLGYLAPSIHSPDYAAMKLLSSYLGNGLSSRLFVELREKRGLAYDVSAFYPTRLHPSQFVTYMGTAPDNLNTATTGLRQEVDRLKHESLAEEELQAAKNKLLGQYALGKQTNAQIAQIFGWYETLGLGVEFDQQFQDRIAAVTPQMAQAAACQYLTEPYQSLVGPVSVMPV